MDTQHLLYLGYQASCSIEYQGWIKSKAGNKTVENQKTVGNMEMTRGDLRKTLQDSNRAKLGTGAYKLKWTNGRRGAATGPGCKPNPCFGLVGVSCSECISNAIRLALI